MQINAKPNCPLHNLPLLYLCCLTNCSCPMTVCQACQTFHSQHKQKLITFQNFIPLIISNTQRQNALDAEVLKQNDILSHELVKFRQHFDDRQKQLISSIMKHFQEQKTIIMQRLRADRKKQKDKVIQYFDKMSEKGLLNYRILFSSQVGIQNFYRAYKQYCDFSDISCHIKEDILPAVEEQQDEGGLMERVRRSFEGTLMQEIMNYIKLKVSKRDMMRITTVAKQCNSVIKVAPPPPPPPRNIGLPPLSPTRRVKVGKTQVKIMFNNTEP